MIRIISAALAIALISPIAAQASTLVYEGRSLTSESQNEACRLELAVDNLGRINGFQLSGEGKVWEILRENGSSYTPGSSFQHTSLDFLKPQQFAAGNFDVSTGIFSDKLVLKGSIKSSELPIGAKITLTLKGDVQSLRSAEGEMKYGTILIPLAKSTIECVDLKLVSGN